MSITEYAQLKDLCKIEDFADALALRYGQNDQTKAKMVIWEQAVVKDIALDEKYANFSSADIKKVVAWERDLLERMKSTRYLIHNDFPIGGIIPISYQRLVRGVIINSWHTSFKTHCGWKIYGHTDVINELMAAVQTPQEGGQK